MDDWLQRTLALIGEGAFERLNQSHVIVFGLGGVGSYAVETLARCGVGKMTIVDADAISVSNINRQLFALHSTVGKLKTQVAAERIADINPLCKVTQLPIFYDSQQADAVFAEKYDFCIDAIDTVSAKIDLVLQCKERDIPIISCMGTGNKIDPSMLKIADIYNTAVCPLARVMRHELKKRGIKKLKVLYSEEKPIKEIIEQEKRTPASISFVPGTAGLMIAGEVIRDIIGLD